MVGVESDRASSNARRIEILLTEIGFAPEGGDVYRTQDHVVPGSVRRRGGQLDSFPLEYSSAPSNGAGAEVKQRIYKHFTPHGVKVFAPG